MATILTIIAMAITAVGNVSAASLFGIRARSNSELYSVGTASGAATILGQTGIFVGDGLAPSSSADRLWAMSGDQLYSVSTTSGAATLIRDFANAFTGNGLAYDPGRGLLYASDYGSGNVYLIVPGTGAFSLLGSGVSLHGLAYSSFRDTLYGVGTNSLYSINVVTGGSSAVGSLGVEFSNGGSGLSYESQSDVLYASSRNQTDLYAIDPDIGLAVSVGALGVGAIHGLASVPEASSSALFVLAGFSIFLRRRKSAKPKTERTSRSIQRRSTSCLNSGFPPRRG